jgi:glyceraldehyde-3-phosphate dehydrogenase/erythrose-4-phosphate dehydrogenase
MPLSGDETGSDADRRGVQQPRSWRNAVTIRVGINGFRRIGAPSRRLPERTHIEVVAVNDVTDEETGLVIPELADGPDLAAVPVPVEDGSMTSLTAVLGRDVTAAEGCGGDA